jgi:release factor glutamine methyltransferase
LFRYIQKEIKDINWVDIANRLLNQEPIDYIIEHTYFYKHKIFVNKEVLIPRPETEELIENIFNIYKDKSSQPKKILEVGTGSGCIAIALKSIFPNAEIIALDISKNALDIAHQNAIHNQLEVKFIELNFLDSNLWGNLEVSFDLIVSNPPYIPIAEKSTMLKNVLDFEPHVALFVEDTSPLLFYDKIFEFAKSHLTKKGHIFCETSENIQFLNHDFFNIKSLKDWSGNSRFIHATFI